MVVVDDGQGGGAAAAEAASSPSPLVNEISATTGRESHISLISLLKPMLHRATAAAESQALTCFATISDCLFTLHTSVRGGLPLRYWRFVNRC